MYRSRLYFECHVTIDPVFEEDLSLVKAIGQKHGFSVAELLMQKRKEDCPERSKYDTFLTGRAKEYENLKYRMCNLINELTHNNTIVRRAKIEDTLFDTKYGDVL